MNTRRLGHTDLELSMIGLGTWAIGGPWVYGWGKQDDDESQRAIHAALDMGVNWLDTAPVYGLGHSELVVGKAIKDRRDKVIVATKCSLTWVPGTDDIIPCMSAQSVRQECEQSLVRLGIDTIDLYQIHWPNPDEQIEEGWGAIAELVREGKVRHAGVSNFSVEQMRRAQAIHPVASLQPPYNLIARDIEQETLPFCEEQDIGVVAYSPMHSGLLTGRFSEAYLASLPDDDWRKSQLSPEFQPPRLGPTLDLVEKLRPIADRAGITVAQLAVTWTLRKQAVTSAIIGVRNEDQARKIFDPDPAVLSDEDLELIESYLQVRTDQINQAQNDALTSAG